MDAQELAALTQQQHASAPDVVKAWEAAVSVHKDEIMKATQHCIHYHCKTLLSWLYTPTHSNKSCNESSSSIQRNSLDGAPGAIKVAWPEKHHTGTATAKYPADSRSEGQDANGSATHADVCQQKHTSSSDYMAHATPVSAVHLLLSATASKLPPDTDAPKGDSLLQQASTKNKKGCQVMDGPEGVNSASADRIPAVRQVHHGQRLSDRVNLQARLRIMQAVTVPVAHSDTSSGNQRQCQQAADRTWTSGSRDMSGDVVVTASAQETSGSVHSSSRAVTAANSLLPDSADVVTAQQLSCSRAWPRLAEAGSCR